MAKPAGRSHGKRHFILTMVAAVGTVFRYWVLSGVASVKAVFAVLVAAALLAPAPLQAQVIDLSTVRCKEFVDSNKDTINAILMWLEGYYTDEEDPPIIDFGKMKEKAEQLTTYCAQNPTIGIMNAAEGVMAK
jgi:acid stress chaperone HdeB